MKLVLQINLIGEYDEEVVNRGMSRLGELVVNKVKANVRSMRLIGEKAGGAYLQGWLSKWTGNTLIIENTQPYAIYLEYGTYSYWDDYGWEDFPENIAPKKKDLPIELAKALPKGMQPFAPVRRVIYNEQIMKELVEKAFS